MLQFGAKTVISGNSTLLYLCPWLDELRKRKGEKSIDIKGEGGEIQLSRLRIHFDDFLADRPSTVSEGRDPARDARRPLGLQIRLSLFLCEYHNWHCESRRQVADFSLCISQLCAGEWTRQHADFSEKVGPNRRIILHDVFCAILFPQQLRPVAMSILSFEPLAFRLIHKNVFFSSVSSVLLVCRFLHSESTSSG